MAYQSGNETMTEQKPGSINAAIAKAIGQVRQLGKNERNKFDGYDFVSIDKFLAMVNPICADCGLFPWTTTAGIELYDNVNSKGGKSVWGRYTFEITLNHAGGESIGPATIIVAVPMNGAQASGSAQSYALKQFFRGVFMIPTGDKDDADLNALDTAEQIRGKGKLPPVEYNKPDRPSEENIITAVETLEGSESLDDLKARWGMLGKPLQLERRVFDAKDRRKTQLAAANTGGAIDDEIPY
jgi:hypothetical protein